MNRSEIKLYHSTNSILLAVLSHRFFLNTDVSVNQRIDGFELKITNNGDKISVEIMGSSNDKQLIDFFFTTYSLLFLYLGSFPSLDMLSVNGEKKDTTNLVGKYKTDSNNIRIDRTVCDINDDAFSNQVFQNYNNLSIYPMHSLQFLLSQDYTHVIIPHRLTLLLHIIDGLFDDKDADKHQNEIQKKYDFPKDQRPGKYFVKAFFLCNKHFFSYNDMYDCQILELLDVDQKGFLWSISDTRNWYSHFLCENQKKMRLEKGQDMVFYFEILVFAIRLEYADKLGIPFNTNVIREFYYSVHDWISKEKYGDNAEYKSILYKFCEINNSI